EVGRLDVDAEPPPEPVPQALLHPGELVGGPVGRDDDLALRSVQGVERVEELGLGLLALRQELDVVDEQHVDIAVPALELVALSSRTALVNSVTHVSEVPYITRSDGIRRSMAGPMGNKSWVFPRPHPPSVDRGVYAS